MKKIKKEIAEKNIEEGIEHNPYKNPNAISIIKQPDGNYKGYIQKNGKVIEVRQGDPRTVLEMLITHE